MSLLDFPSQNAVRRNHSECVPSGIASPGWGDLTQPLTTQVWSVPHPGLSLGLAWSVPLTHRLAYPPAGPGQPQPGHTPAEAPRPCWGAREPEHPTLPAGRACVCPSQTSPSVGTGTHEGPTSWEPWAGGAAWPLGSAACWGECPVALPGDSFRPGLCDTGSGRPVSPIAGPQAWLCWECDTILMVGFHGCRPPPPLQIPVTHPAPVGKDLARQSRAHLPAESWACQQLVDTVVYMSMSPITQQQPVGLVLFFFFFPLGKMKDVGLFEHLFHCRSGSFKSGERMLAVGAGCWIPCVWS